MRQITETGLLAALIFVTGLVKLPGLVSGSEFQLSAPLAVAVCAVFGFRRYISAGVVASLIGLALGGQTVLNVLVAMVFRLTVGGILALAGTSWPVIVLAGPAGSIVARLALAAFIGIPAAPLVAAAVPGMAITAAAAWSLTLALRKIKIQTGRVLANVLQR